jgi:hypothetical protein
MQTTTMIRHLEEVQEATLGRFQKRQARAIDAQGWGASVAALGIAEAYCNDLSKIIAERLGEVTQSLRASHPLWPLKGFSYVVRNLDPDLIAAATLTNFLHSVATGCDYRETSLNVGRAVQAECWAAGLLAFSPKLHGRIKRAVKARHSNLAYRKQAARSIAAKAGYRGRDWSNEETIRAGGFLFDCVMEAMPDVFVVTEGEREQRWPQLRPEALEIAEAAVERSLLGNPVFFPCVEQPAPWTARASRPLWSVRSIRKPSPL